jgi:flagellar hook-basal body complex protein FliE
MYNNLELERPKTISEKLLSAQENLTQNLKSTNETIEAASNTNTSVLQGILNALETLVSIQQARLDLELNNSQK